MGHDEYRRRLDTVMASVVDALECGTLPPNHRPALMAMRFKLAGMVDEAVRFRRLLDESVSTSQSPVCHRGAYLD